MYELIRNLLQHSAQNCCAADHGAARPKAVSVLLSFLASGWEVTQLNQSNAMAELANASMPP